MLKDCGVPLTKLRVDGKMTSNSLLLQLQADISGIPVGKKVFSTHNILFVLNVNTPSANDQ